MQIENPILRGFNPDPSIVRAGEDYYIATSTFEWFPGVQIHHSRDLVNWRLLTRPLTRVSQLDMKGVMDSGGVWAPCLSHHDGLFYLVYTLVLGGVMNDTYNYLVTAPDIMGPWSEPVHLVNQGFDPSLFHDGDGRKWLLWVAWDYRGRLPMQSMKLSLSMGLKSLVKSGAGGLSTFKGIMLQEYSPALKRLIGDPCIAFRGTQLGVTEGPHIYLHNGHYHLMVAEGGTGRNHAVTFARSRDIKGPYEVHPENPVLTSRGNPDLELHKAGHASLVETQNGEWYLAHLCARPVKGTRDYRCTLGRETALQKVVWGSDGWLKLVHGDRFPRINVPAPDLPAHPWTARKDRDDFDSPELGLDYQSLRVPLGEDTLSLTERPGFLRLKGREGITSLFTQGLVARRQQSFTCTATTCLEFEPKSFLQGAGLIAWYDTGNFYYLRITHDEKQGKVLDILRASHYFMKPLLRRPVSLSGAKRVHLRVSVRHSRLNFSYSSDGRAWKKIGKGYDASILSDEHHELVSSLLDRMIMNVMGFSGESFTGAFVGMCCQDLSGHRQPADFDYFEYCGD
jgi:xylan 1,4-beta-xylosidase